MELITVESSMIHAVGYDSDAKELEVIFNSGRIYRYSDVPQEEYGNLLASNSKGQYMRSNIADFFFNFPSFEAVAQQHHGHTWEYVRDSHRALLLMK